MLQGREGHETNLIGHHLMLSAQHMHDRRQSQGWHFFLSNSWWFEWKKKPPCWNGPTTILETPILMIQCWGYRVWWEESKQGVNCQGHCHSSATNRPSCRAWNRLPVGRPEWAGCHRQLERNEPAGYQEALGTILLICKDPLEYRELSERSESCLTATCKLSLPHFGLHTPWKYWV